MLEDVKEKINPIQGIVYKKLLNVFDENLDKLEKIEGLDSKSERFNFPLHAHNTSIWNKLIHILILGGFIMSKIRRMFTGGKVFFNEHYCR